MVILKQPAATRRSRPGGEMNLLIGHSISLDGLLYPESTRCQGLIANIKGPYLQVSKDLKAILKVIELF